MFDSLQLAESRVPGGRGGGGDGGDLSLHCRVNIGLALSFLGP